MRVFLTALFLSVTVPAFSHEHWINYGGYRSPADGSSCCGPSDCFTLLPGVVREIKGGFSIKTKLEVSQGYEYNIDMLVPYKEATPSEDNDYHLCIKYVDGKPERRCFFAPTGAF